MLQHNKANSAHLAHAAVLSLHSICCGLPALAVSLAAIGVSGVNLGGGLAGLHVLIHAHELWIVALSAGLVIAGAAMEFKLARTHPRRGAPWLFVMSACCLAANIAIIAVHRLLL